jgi:hypothetical protein
MDAAEIGQRGGGQHGVPLASNDGHEDENEGCRNAGSDDRQRKKDAAKAPMEVMTLAKRMERWRAYAGASIKQAITDVNGPCNERQEQRNPRREIDAGCLRKGEGPDNGDGGRIKAGQMPEGEWARSIDGPDSALPEIGSAFMRRRLGERKRHSSDFS